MTNSKNTEETASTVSSTETLISAPTFGECSSMLNESLGRVGSECSDEPGSSGNCTDVTPVLDGLNLHQDTSLTKFSENSIGETGMVSRSDTAVRHLIDHTAIETDVQMIKELMVDSTVDSSESYGLNMENLQSSIEFIFGEFRTDNTLHPRNNPMSSQTDTTTVNSIDVTSKEPNENTTTGKAESESWTDQGVELIDNAVTEIEEEEDIVV